MSRNANEMPYRIICRCVPSPQSKSSVSPSRTTAIALTLRSTVGRAAEVPRKRTERDMAGNLIARGEGESESMGQSVSESDKARGCHSERMRGISDWRVEIPRSARDDNRRGESLAPLGMTVVRAVPDSLTY